MPKKRKEVDTDENGPGAKHSRLCLEIGGFPIHWQWESDNGWVSYTPETATVITEAYTAGQNQVTFEAARKVQMKIIFERMVQKNKMTGWERQIRCAIKSKSNTEFHVWEWEDEHNKWNPYNVEATVAMETALTNGNKIVTLHICKKEYTIDLKAMKQTNNTTNVKRNIRQTNIVIDEEMMQYATVKSELASSKVKAQVSGKEPVHKTTAKSSHKQMSTQSKHTVVKEEPGMTKSSLKTVILKGVAPVDPECSAKVNCAHVYSKGKDVYDVMLNQTNVTNNNNKYYLLQLLEDDNKKSYSVWFRWGRVGYKGQTNLIPFGPNLDDAIETFTKKFYDKTKNEWSMRNKFQKVPGKYDMVKVDYNVEKTLGEKPKLSKAVPPSKLDKKIQSLIDLICDVKKMEAAVIEMKYDAQKSPLGKLTDKQIKAGYAALKKIDHCITNNDFGQKLIQACDAFYTRIPHNFGMQRPPVIRSKADVRLKLQLLEALTDIEIAMKLIKEHNIDENPIDTHYNALKCQMMPIDKTTPSYKIIKEYLQNTHAPTHNQYKMEIVDAFELKKEGDDETFTDKGNRRLLWHGSRLTNWVGILSQGLRIAPPEAPVTGYMFGKGIYFADISSKSANYCYPTQVKTEGLLLLCEVSLGNCNELLAADYDAAKLPPGKHSVMGKGKLAPDPEKNLTLPNGCIVPLGKPLPTGVSNPEGYTLNYNEFVVYDRKQVKMKYLIRVKFNFQ